MLEVQFIAFLIIDLAAFVSLLDALALLIAALLDARLHLPAIPPGPAQIEIATAFVFHPLPLVFSDGAVQCFIVRLLALTHAVFKMRIRQLQSPNSRGLGLRERLTERLISTSDLLLGRPAQ